MYKEHLELAQMVKNHPILRENDHYRKEYINMLEYLVKRYSVDDVWANENLTLYKEQLLEDIDNYQYVEESILRKLRNVLSTKFRSFKFISYRYCFIYDYIFINAPFDKEKAELILKEMILPYAGIHQKKIHTAFQSFYLPNTDTKGLSNISVFNELWHQNMHFFKKKRKHVLVTANMSAGKSTLINAIVGRKVNKTKNETCTAKVHFVLNKAFEDGFIYELDKQLKLNADHVTLMEDNEENYDSSIFVGAYFRSVSEKGRICLIDTPGVNSSQDIKHRSITEQFMKNENVDVLLYVLNGENIGTEDDKRHLCFVQKNYQACYTIFVVNKLDKYRNKEDSIEETLLNVTKDLETIGFKNPVVVPISSYAAYLAKMKLYGEPLTEDEEDDIEFLARKLKREEYQFDRYYSKYLNKKLDFDPQTEEDYVLQHSGILQLEEMLYN